jgi:predicted enzyme related to lactoylglutathione lyase
MFQTRHSALLLFLGLLCAGCASASAAGLPAVSETSDNQRLRSFVWFDLLTPDRAQARSYYAGLLGWEISEAEGFPGYDLISNQRLMIGGIAQVAESEQATWLGSFSVNDVGNAARRVKQLGGRILEPVQSIDDRGVMALVEDDAGAAFVLLDTGSRDPKLRPVRQGDWLWIDLFTRNPVAAGEFYKGLAALRLDTFTNQDGSQSDVLMSGDAATAGVVEIPWKHVDPIWLPYVRVDDVDTTIERSTQLGGRLFYRWGDGAIILDPTGAAFGIQQVSNKGGQGQ